jgi:phospholipid/cholesterol/gamma-HCH transport system permease protein
LAGAGVAGQTDKDGSQAEGWLDMSRSGREATLALGGSWTIATAGGLDGRLQALAIPELSRVTFDLSKMTELDTAGAWLVRRTEMQLRARNIETAVAGAAPAHASLLETVERQDLTAPPPPFRFHWLVGLINRIGEATVVFVNNGRDLLGFLGLTVASLVRVLARPARLRGAALATHMEQSGLDAIPIVGLLAFLIGVVTAYQGADQLARFGAQIFTVNIVGIGILREMGILITAIIVAGRSGSAFAAQIGTMKVNEEVDAMRTIGIDPIETLVLPRVIALVLVMPLLTFWSDIAGIVGGAVQATVSLDITIVQFFRQLRTAVNITSFYVGMTKAPLFGFVIALVGCFEGFKVTRSAESVGSHTTTAVVEAVFLVIVLDAFLSIFYSEFGW